MTHRVDWNPEHTAHAVTAMQEVIDETYSGDDDAVEVDKATADAVNARYRELVANDPEINPAEPQEESQ
jgi:hypothetical protein